VPHSASVLAVDAEPGDVVVSLTYWTFLQHETENSRLGNIISAIIMDNTIPFIVITPQRQSVENRRKLIRSHVMRGRNRKKRPAKPPSWINGNEAKAKFDATQENAVVIPAKVGGEFSLAAIPAEISPDMLEPIWKRTLKSFVSDCQTDRGLVKTALSPFDFQVDSNTPDPSWFEPVWQDAACLHFSIFVATVYLNSLKGQKSIDCRTMAHFAKALAIIRSRLVDDDKELAISDTTILVVVGLAMTATAHGDAEAASYHIGGLQKMIMLRGGLSTFRHNKRLQVKILRQVHLGELFSMSD
jgi:hypothetical protein